MPSIIIPAFNEEKRITHTVEHLLSFMPKLKKRFEIIIVADGTDSTAHIVKTFSTSHPQVIKLLQFPKRLGKGGALIQGIKHSKFDEIVLFDADESMPAREIPLLLRGLKDSDIVIGSRNLPKSRVSKPFSRLISSFLSHLEIAFLFGIREDTQSGFKALRKPSFERLPRFKNMNYIWDVELICNAKKKGLKVKEVPITWEYKPGSKLSLLDAVAMLLQLISYKLFKH